MSGSMTQLSFNSTPSSAANISTFLRTGRRWLPQIGGALAGLLALTYGAHWWLSERFIETTDNAYVRADVAVISSRIAGHIATVVVCDNQAVRRGDVLAKLDDAPYQARRDQAKAAVAAAQADVVVETAAIATIDAQLAQQRSLIVQAGAETVTAEAEVQRTSLELQRQEALVAREVASRQRLESAEADQKKSVATLAAGRAALAGQHDRLTVLTEQRQGRLATLEKARAAVSQAQATLELSLIDVANTVIRAPVDGVVGQRTIRVGQYVDPGQPLLAVVPVQAVYVVANLKETQLDRVMVGQPVALDVDAFDGEPLSGHVESFAPASGAQFALLPPDNATGNFTKIVQRLPVRISIDPGQHRAADLRPGLSVVARIDTRRGEAQR
ncbi:MAG: hypothetical protein C207_01043 [Bradyrhizobium sp. DFCI-1]|jgi:membrane fusion protein, multidrug efflux system|nr:MAG: hypothetical protein C207_01043 [Bradyrhizobium sp. DFCI-1]